MAVRWGAHTLTNAVEYNPSIAASAAVMRARLAGVKVLGVEQEAKVYGKLKLTQEAPVVEVYLHNAPPDFPHVTAIAPPWSTLPCISWC
jgi:hypothetical protein